MFYSFEFAAAVERLSYIGDKSSYAPVGTTLFGSFQPIDQEMNVIALQIQGQAYEFITDAESDIKAQDKITITDLEGNSDEYRVKGIQKFIVGGMRYLKCILEFSVKN